jgi:hypothetical protein
MGKKLSYRILVCEIEKRTQIEMTNRRNLTVTELYHMIFIFHLLVKKRAL